MSKIITIIILTVILPLIIYSQYYYYSNLKKLDNKFISHTNEPCSGQLVYNNNPNCKHFNSLGKVLNIKELNGDMGKVITYKVLNDGKTFKTNDILIKTMDQLVPLS